MAGNTEHTYYGGNQSGDSGVKHGEIHQLVIRNAASGQMQYNPLIDGTVLRSVPLYLRKLGVDDPELFNPLAHADDVPTFKQIVLPYLEAAAEYDENETYTAGRLAVSNNKLYISTAATTGTFDPSKWTQIHNIDELYASCVTAETSDSSAFDGNTKIATGISGGRLKLNLASRLWTWIKNQISTVLGLTDTAYGGKAATAGVADSANAVDWSNVNSKPTIPAKDSELVNDRYVRYDTASQNLNTTQRGNARTNIGAGTYSKPVNGIPTTDIEGVNSSTGDASKFMNEKGQFASPPYDQSVTGNTGSTTTAPCTKAVYDWSNGYRVFTAARGDADPKSNIPGPYTSSASISIPANTTEWVIVNEGIISETLYIAIAPPNNPMAIVVDVCHFQWNPGSTIRVRSKTGYWGNIAITKICTKYNSSNGKNAIYLAVKNTSTTSAITLAMYSTRSGITLTADNSAHADSYFDTILNIESKTIYEFSGKYKQSNGVVLATGDLSTSIANDSASNAKAATPKAVYDFATQQGGWHGVRPWNEIYSNTEVSTPLTEICVCDFDSNNRVEIVVEGRSCGLRISKDSTHNTTLTKSSGTAWISGGQYINVFSSTSQLTLASGANFIASVNNAIAFNSEQQATIEFNAVVRGNSGSYERHICAKIALYATPEGGGQHGKLYCVRASIDVTRQTKGARL